MAIFGREATAEAQGDGPSAALDVEYVSLSSGRLSVHPMNARRGDVATIRESIRENGFYGTIIAQRSTGQILVGNHRYLAAVEEGLPDIPVVWVDKTDAEAARLLLVDNRSSDIGTYENSNLVELLELVSGDFDTLLGTGYQDSDLLQLLEHDGDPGWSPPPPGSGYDPLGELPARGNLAERFIVPPFSVLDTRRGYWRNRKQAWLALGIESELGRRANLLEMSDTILLADNGISIGSVDAMPNRSSPANVSGNVPAFFYKKQELERIAGRELTTNEVVAAFQERSIVAADGSVVAYDPGELWEGAGTSIFDPVLCELAYRWFCPRDGMVLDPFAGGSVRGLVAGRLGCSYYGVDLRGEQIEANEEQRDRILGADAPVRWHQGDATQAESWTEVPEGSADLVFTCPPYYDLEVYSEDPADLCNAEDIDGFFDLLGEALGHADRRLADNRFACVVMGEVRQRGGDRCLYDMIGRTVETARRIGWSYYNDAILVTAVGSLAIRAGRIFTGGRKLARTHQYVLVFVKGDGLKAHKACGELTDLVADLEAVE